MSCVIQTCIANNDIDECRKVAHRYLGNGPNCPVVHLQHLMITDSTFWSGIMPDNPVLRHNTYTDWSRLDCRVGVCDMALRRTCQSVSPTTVPEGNQTLSPKLLSKVFLLYSKTENKSRIMATFHHASHHAMLQGYF